MNDDLQLLSDKIDYLTKLIETMINENEPCKNRNKNPKEDLLKILESPSLAKNPMFKQMIEPIKDILSKV